jgi:hypothetical protein
MLIIDLLSAANVVMGLMVCILNLRYWRTSSAPWRWIKGVYAFVGLTWAIIYIVALVFYDGNLGLLGPYLVRPFITVTLSVMAAGALIRAKS